MKSRWAGGGIGLRRTLDRNLRSGKLPSLGSLDCRVFWDWISCHWSTITTTRNCKFSPQRISVKKVNNVSTTRYMKESIGARKWMRGNTASRSTGGNSAFLSSTWPAGVNCFWTLRKANLVWSVGYWNVYVWLFWLQNWNVYSAWTKYAVRGFPDPETYEITTDHLKSPPCRDFVITIFSD